MINVFSIVIISSLVIISIAAVFIYIRGKQNYIKMVQKKVLKSDPGLASLLSFPVKHKTKFSVLTGLLSPREGGILTVDAGRVKYSGYKGKKNQVKFNFKALDTEVVWMGRNIPGSVVHWFMVKNGAESHYFSAETGRNFSDNEKESKEMFDSINSHMF